MSRTYHPAPWHSTPDNWEEMGLSDTPTFPGLTPTCSSPVQGAPPMVHRFLDIFIRNNLAMPFPAMEDMDQLTTSGQVIPNQDPLRMCDLNLNHCYRSWQIRRPVWAMAVMFEQAWYWLGSSLGELAESLSLTPGEELGVEVFAWDRSKTSHDLQTSDLVDRKSENSLTVHASSQVVKRMEEQTQWQIGANVGFSRGVTAGIEASYGETETDSLERRREQRQDQTRKTAEQIRSERQIKIATSQEVGFEERHKRTLKNDNPTRTVTYNFYETLSHYRVELAMVETQTAVAIPNRLPRITPDWVVCYEGIIRSVLLDSTQDVGFEAARDLKRGFDLDKDVIGEAARLLREAFLDRDTIIRDFEPIEVIPPPSIGQAFVRALMAALSLGATEIVTGTVELVNSLSDSPPNSEDERPSGAYIEEFLLGVEESPSLNGLIASIKLVADYHVPYYEQYGAYLRPTGYIMTEEIDRALGNCQAAILSVATAASPEITGGDADDTEEAARANQAAWLAWKTEQSEKAYSKRNAHAQFGGLKCHIEKNLLHYMRAIWIIEDPEVRMRRHAAELGMGLSELKQFVSQPLLGFHLNCCVYPCDPPAYENMVPMMSRRARELRTFIDANLRRSALKRFGRKAQRVLNNTIESAVQETVICSGEKQPLNIESIPSVLKNASKQIEKLRHEVTKGQGWVRYLSASEKAAKAGVESQINALEKAAEEAAGSIEGGLIDEIGQIHTTIGERLHELNEQRNFSPIIVTLPDGGYHSEPVLGQCQSAEALRLRQLEAEVKLGEAKADRLRKKVDDLSAEQLMSETNVPTIEVRLREND